MPEFDELRRAAEALQAHTSRTEVRQRHRLEADFRELATPERILELIDRIDELELQMLADAAAAE